MRRGAGLILGALLLGGLLVGFRAFRARPYRVPEQVAARPVATGQGEAPPSAPSSPPPGPAPRTGPLLDGRPVPPLPDDAPKSASFGVIVLSFRGAEGAAADAPPKEVALARAKALLPEAERDFDEAVKKGDRGSMADVGSVPRGVLEPALEYALFTSKKGQVYGAPLEAPRGYWILRRR